jgi:hypothetical protein
MAGSFVLLVVALAMGAALIWDIGGFATRMRQGLENGIGGELYRRLPQWTLRVFGYWCVLFGFGQLVLIYAITHH